MTTLHGLTTMVLTADDVESAVAWYSEFLGTDPYFRQPPVVPPAYVEFRLGPDEDELGIMNRAYAPAGTATPGTSITYWHVDDVPGTLTHLLAQGATPHMPVTDRGEGFRTASVVDPFGNVLGLMHSPHWGGRH